MHDSWIYSDFVDNIKWMKKIHRNEYQDIDSSLSALAEYYFTKRLSILNKKPVKYDPRLGRPAPYLAFWFADALGLRDETKVNKLALTTSYSSIICSIRDDLIDGRVKLHNGKLATEHAHVSLANYFYDKYLKIFRGFFPHNSIFWYILSESLNRYQMYEYWNFLINRERRLDPLSAQFLKRSSQYMVEVFLPSLSAISLLTGNEAKISRVNSFLINYFMGVRIADDLRDWQRDLKAPNYNCSTVIHHSLHCGNRQEIGLDGMRSMFFSKNFVISLYGTILRCYRAAKKDASSFHSDYLDEFMNSQIQYYETERDYLLNRSAFLGRSLQSMLESRIIDDKIKLAA